MLPPHLRDRDLNRLSDLARAGIRTVVRPASPASCPVRYRATHRCSVARCTPARAATSTTSAPSRTARTASRRCSTTDKTTSANPGLPSPTSRGNVAPEWPKRGHCRRSHGGGMSHVSRRRTRCTCNALPNFTYLIKAAPLRSAAGAHVPGSALERPPSTCAPRRAREPRPMHSFKPRYGPVDAGHLPRLPLSSSQAPRLGRPRGVAARWLRQPSVDPAPTRKDSAPMRKEGEL